MRAYTSKKSKLQRFPTTAKITDFTSEYLSCTNSSDTFETTPTIVKTDKSYDSEGELQ